MASVVMKGRFIGASDPSKKDKVKYGVVLTNDKEVKGVVYKHFDLVTFWSVDLKIDLQNQYFFEFDIMGDVYIFKNVMTAQQYISSIS